MRIDDFMKCSGLSSDEFCARTDGCRKCQEVREKQECPEGFVRIAGSTEMDIEILPGPKVQCPVNGWQLLTHCESDRIYRYGNKPCPFYQGRKELVDLKGEHFKVIHCLAGKLRKDIQK